LSISRQEAVVVPRDTLLRWKQGNECKIRDRFDCDDLLRSAKLLDQALAWIVTAASAKSINA
jgi:hypothetical protein